MAPKKPGPNVKKFGMPLYASAWLDERTLVVAGGGGKKSSGIPNRMCVATFDGVTLSEPLFSCHTDETAPQGLIPTPDKTRLLCVFSGDVALYDVAPNPDPPDTLGDTEESDPPPTSGPAVVPCTIVPSDPIADGVAHRITLADCDIKCAAFSSDGERLAVGLEDGRVQLCAWRRATEKDLHIEVVATLGQHTDAVTGIAFSPDDTLILTTSAESASKPGQGAAVWSVAEKSRVRALSDPSVPAAARGASYRFAAFGPAGSNSAYTCLNIGGEGYATRWNTRDWTVISRRRVGKDPVTAAALSPDGGCLVAGDSEGRVVILDAATFATRSVEKDAHMIFVTTVACNDDGTAALSGSADASACARDARRSGAAGSVARVLFAVFACLALAWLFVFVGSRAAFLSASAARGRRGASRRGSTCWTASIWDTPRRWRSGSWRAWRARAAEERARRRRRPRARRRRRPRARARARRRRRPRARRRRRPRARGGGARAAEEATRARARRRRRRGGGGDRARGGGGGAARRGAAMGGLRRGLGRGRRGVPGGGGRGCRVGGGRGCRFGGGRARARARGPRGGRR